MEYRYTPEGVCSREFIIHMDGDIITKVEIIGGCPGNTLAVTHLIEGSNINDVIKVLNMKHPGAALWTNGRSGRGD